MDRDLPLRRRALAEALAAFALVFPGAALGAFAYQLVRGEGLEPPRGGGG